MSPLDPPSAEGEQRARRLAARMRAVATVASGGLRARSYEQLDSVLQAACAQILDHDVFTFAVYHPQEHTLRFLGGWDGEMWESGLTVPLAGTPSDGVVRQRRSLLTLRSDDPASIGAAPFGTPRRSESVIRVPVLNDDQVLAVLSVQSYTPDAYGAEDVEVLEVFAAVTASALQNVQLLAEQRSMQEMLRQSEERFRAIFEQSALGIVEGNPDSGRLLANPAMQRLLGIGSEVTLQDIERRTHPDDLGADRRLMAEITSGVRDRFELEKRYVRPDGSLLWGVLNVSAVRGPDGELRLAFGTVADITARKLAEAQLMRRDAVMEAASFAAERLLRCPDWQSAVPEVLARLGTATEASRAYLFQNHPGPDGSVRTSQRFEWVAEGVEPQIGRPELQALSLEEAGLGRWQEMLSSGEVVQGPVDSLPAGEQDPLRTQGIRSLVVVPIFVAREWWGFVGFDDRWTERHWSIPEREALRAAASTLSAAIERNGVEAALRESERWVRTLFSHAADGIAVHDLSGRMLDFNERLCDMLGYSRSELLALGVADLDAEWETERFDERWRQMEPGVPVTLQGKLLHKNGGIIPMEVRVSRVEMEGRPVLLALLRDVSDRMRLEEQLRQSQKMEAVGRLAGGVAHDFNNQLTAILGFAKMMELELPEGTQLATYLTEIERAAERSARLTHQLLAFGRRQILQPEVLSIGSVVERMDLLLRRLIGAGVELVSIPSSGTGLVRADPGQMEQVLVNLVVNARDAVGGSGRVLVQTLERSLEESLPCGHCTIPAGDYVVLAVSDDGCGMDQDTLRHIFEPFFTTKEQGKGTGLGLATVLGVVQQSEGYVCVHSVPGEGSTFQVFLPRVQGSVGAERAAVPRRAAHGEGTVLLVEDEGAVRALLRAVLRRAGYEVLEADNGEAALRAWAEHHGRIDLVITDLTMPLLGGLELGRRLAQEPDAVPIVYMSGYTDDLHGLDRSGSHFLAKPFAPEALMDLVAAARQATPPR